MALFLSVPGQIVFYVVFILLIFMPTTIILILRKKAGSLKVRSTSKFSTPRTWSLNVPLAIFVTLLLGYTQIGPLPDWSYYLGLSMLVLGLAIVCWGSLTLGRYFSGEIVIYQGHQLVERGPYRFVRHPVYSGYYLVAVGMAFAVQSWAAVVVLVILYAILFRYRIAAEEKVLIAEFGEQYKSYSRRVKRLIPFIL